MTGTTDYELDRGIAVERTAPGEYAAHLDSGWVVGGGVNGGYLLAVSATRSATTSTTSASPTRPVSVATT